MSTQHNPQAIANLAPGAEWAMVNDDLDRLEWLDDDIARPTDAAIEAEAARIAASGETSMARMARNLRLTQSDWTQLGDVALTDAQVAEWATYRQALRDVDWRTEPIPWPTPPA